MIVPAYVWLSPSPPPRSCISDWTVAEAFDFFGLFGSDDTPPAVSRTAIPYSFTVQVAGDVSGLKDSVRDASSLYSLRKDAPPDGEALARRAQSDFAPVIDALWGAGYYNASVTIAIDGASLAIGSSDIAAFARAAEAYRNRAAAPVVIKVEPGPLFKLRTVRVVDALGVEFPEAELPQRIVGLKPGDPAAASEIRAAQTRIVDYFRKQGRPLAKIQSVAPVVDHAQDIMDVSISVAPGPIAPFGEATINGPQTFDPAIVRSFLYIHPGDPYSPAAIADARNSIRQIPAVGGVRITEGTTLDAYGRLPYQVDVEDRLPYAVGASMKYSTTNGPEGQVYWEDRNVFGGAERLRLQADVFYAPPWYISSQSLRHFSSNDIGGRVSASFLKPALWGTTNDLLINALAEKVSTSGAGFVGYQAEDADVTASLRHRFNQNFWVQAGLEAQKGDATDALGTVNYTAGRRSRVRQFRHDGQQARPDARRAAQRLRRGLWHIPRLEPRSRSGEGRRLRLLFHRRRLALRARRAGRGRRDGRPAARRDPSQLALLCGRRRLGARLRL